MFFRQINFVGVFLWNIFEDTCIFQQIVSFVQISHVYILFGIPINFMDDTIDSSY